MKRPNNNCDDCKKCRYYETEGETFCGFTTHQCYRYNQSVEQRGMLNLECDSYTPYPADVVPVVHAKWRESNFIVGMLTCSNCGAQRNPNFKIGGGAWYYCPNCGAKMDLEEGKER